MRLDSRWFELGREFRFWRGQQTKLVVLILGFALVCALLALALRLSQLLFEELPPWASSEQSVYSLYRLHNDGSIDGIAKTAIQALDSLPQVEQTAWLWPLSFEVTDPEGRERILLAMVFSESFFRMLAPDLAQQVQGEGIWLTQGYLEQSKLGPEQLTQAFFSRHNVPSPLPVRGVLPAQFDQLGRWTADIWLSENYLAYITPFVPDNTMLVDRFLQAVPQYYGLFTTRTQVKPQELTSWLRQADLSVAGMSFQGDGAQPVIYEGINFDPTAKATLIKQWTLLLVLLILFGALMVINALILYSARVLEQQATNRTLQILGASPSRLVRGMLQFLGLKCLLIALLAGFLLQLVGALVSASAAWQHYMRGAELAIHWGPMLAAWLITSAIILGAALLPTLKQSGSPLFQRQMTTGLSRWAKRTELVMLTVQVAIVLFAMTLTLQLLWGQWQQQQLQHVTGDIQVTRVAKFGAPVSVKALQQNLPSSLPADAVAFANSWFEQPTTVVLEDAGKQLTQSVQVHHVSENYFKVLGVPVLAGHSTWQGGVVVNTSLARALAGTDDWVSVLGRELDLGMIYGKQRIAAVTEVIPHLGRAATALPAVYLPLSSTSSRFEVYLSAAQATEQLREDWLNSQISTAEIEHYSLQQQIAEQDRLYHSLVIFSLLVALVLLSAVLVGLFYHVKTRIIAAQREYATLIAIGAPPLWLLLRSGQNLLLATFIAIPLALFLLLNYQWALASLGLSSTGLPAVLLLLVLLATLLVLIVVTYIPLQRQILRVPFAQLR